MRWTDRLLGLVSTLVLARLLTPADFGLVAMAMVVAGLVDVLLDLGVGSALIQNREATREDFDTAWTLRLLQSACAALLLVAAAPAVASYYADPRVIPVLQVIALSVIVGGLENIGIVSFQRNLEFGRDFQFFFAKKVVAMLIAIGIAVALRSYWALVLGGLASRVTGVVLSYWLSRFRPRITLARFRNIWAFSQWNLLIGIGRYVNGALGRFFIGGRASAGDLGTYTVGEEIASMPVTELLAPLGRVMFPVFAQVKSDQRELLRVVMLAQSVQALIAIPASVGLALIAGDAVPLLLGKQWNPAVPVVQIIALAGISTSLGHSLGYLLIVLGRVRTVGLFSWVRVLLLAGLLYLAVPSGNPVEVAVAVLVTAIAGFLGFQLIARRALPGFGARMLVLQVWRPLTAAALMCPVVYAVGHELAGTQPIVRLAAQILSGCLCYAVAILMLWRASGTQEGAESYFFDKLGWRPW